MIADPSPWLAVFGRAHPVLLHAPLGILPAIAVLEFGALLLRRPSPRGSVLTLAVLAAGSAAAAAASGWVLGGESPGSELQTEHKTYGLILAGLSLLLPVLAMLAVRLPFRVLLLAACGVMVPAGHLGGSLTHGKNFLFEPLEAAKAKAAPPTAPPAERPPAELPAASDPTKPPPPSAPAASEYTTVIVPILERVCVSCHNPDKTKGELLLTTREGLDKGGENGVVVVPGKPDDSPLVTRCELPVDHDDHMPPDGKKQPTPDEVAALRRWVQNGAR